MERRYEAATASHEDKITSGPLKVGQHSPQLINECDSDVNEKRRQIKKWGSALTMVRDPGNGSAGQGTSDCLLHRTGVGVSGIAVVLRSRSVACLLQGAVAARVHAYLAFEGDRRFRGQALCLFVAARQE